MPSELIKSFILLKQSIAEVNKGYGLDTKIAAAIIEASKDFISEKIDMSHFPLVIW